MGNEEWREEKKRKRAQMEAMQKLPYEIKVKRAELRAREFVEKLDDMGLEAHVSVGGLDSIVLLLFLRALALMCQPYPFRLWRIKAFRPYIKN